MKRFLSVCSIVALGAGIGVAHADVINVTLNSGLGCATTSCGTITITDVAGGVTVSETLTPNYFVVTGHDGNHPSLALDLDSGTVTSASFTGFSSLPTGDTWNVGTNADPAGYKNYDYDWYVYLSGSNGGNNTSVQTLSFTITGVTTADFDLTSPIVSDIADVSDNSKTGNVSGVGHLTPTSPTPEPSSLALLGSGVLGLAGVVRRRYKR